MTNIYLDDTSDRIDPGFAEIPPPNDDSKKQSKDSTPILDTFPNHDGSEL